MTELTSYLRLRDPNQTTWADIEAGRSAQRASYSFRSASLALTEADMRERLEVK